MRQIQAFGERAKALAGKGRYDEAEAALRQGLKVAPDHPVLSYALGILLLARGAYDEGFRLYEHRGALPGGPSTPRLSFPQWTGAPTGSLLVLPEQGLGDQIMYARYVPLIVARGVAVTLVVPPPLARLMAPLGAEILVADGPIRIPQRDHWCFLGSLPGLLGGSIPAAPYLPGRPGGAGVGLMLSGGPKAGERTLPQNLAAELAPLGRSLHPDDTGARDFEATAEIVRGLELVISVDTSVVHLAGAMGKPVWVLTPEPCDWRWGRSGAGSLWYPSARLFRQPRPGDWRSAVDAIRAALADRISRPVGAG